jgi:peptide/nickel transport system ATP-binding protein
VKRVVKSVVESVLLQVEQLIVDYPLPRQQLWQPAPVFRALHGVSLTLAAGKSLGIVGESGCGKSTLARAVMALETPSSGQVSLLGQELFSLSADALKTLRRQFQMVFQDPYSSLDPRHKVGRIVAEPLSALSQRLNAQEKRERIEQALDEVGLRPADAERYPHEFSGGQRQRIAIARALITRPALIVADEPVSALDVSVQAQVLNLLLDLQQRHGIAYLFISHDLSIVRHVTDHIAVMQAGKIVEQGVTDTIFRTPQHDYTRALLEAIPRPDPTRRRRRSQATR